MILTPSHKSPARGSTKAMTLVEVIVAMCVMVILFGAAFSALIQVNKITAAAKARTRAVAILNNGMEDLRSRSFDAITTGLAATVPTSANETATFTGGYMKNDGLAGTKGIVYRWTRTRDNATTGEILKVNLKVEWSVGTQQYSLSSYTYVSKYGVVAKS